MLDPYTLLYQSPELASDSNVYIDYTCEASALGAKRTYHYHAKPNASKGIEPHIALLDSAVSENSQSGKTARPPGITVGTSQSVSILNPPSTERTGKSKPPSSLSERIQDAKSRPPRLPRAMEDDLPQGDGKNMLAWSDDDVDATDLKNMPDYDSWQEESNYESTPEPEATAEPLEDLSIKDKSRIRRYVMLHSKQNSERTSPAEEISGRQIPYLPIVNRDLSHQNHGLSSPFTNQHLASEKIGTPYKLTYNPFPSAPAPKHKVFSYFLFHTL